MGAVGASGWPTDLPGRPTWPMGPTASTRARGASPLVPYVGCAGFTPWLPAINTRGWRIGHTHTTHHSPLLSCIPCIVFRLSGVYEKSRSHRVAGVARESGMGSSLALSCNIRLFVIELDYGYRYLLEVYSELSSICFLSWLCYYSMLALHDRPVLV